jgi:methylenetetrahydrofolate dehydrogenase (NADP+)/methenyltetrahydrofolate cyclohydrolase
MLQLPLDTQSEISARDVQSLLEAISPHKDADGLHASNLGKLFVAESTHQHWHSPLPATALGIMRLLEHYKIDCKGRDVCVIGKSRLVGLPTATLLTHAGATVTVCHRGTRDLPAKIRQASLVIAAAGAKHLVKGDDVSAGSVLIDVGIHVDEDGKLSGDIHPNAQAKASAFSPVPGGVGPMTVACLIENTVRLFALQKGLRWES